MPLRDRYRRALSDHGYAADPAQEAAVERLEALCARVERAANPAPTLLGRVRARLVAPAPAGRVRGVYLWGGVGRGKTFLMDLFHGALGVPARRSHFHRFMRDVHARLKLLRGLELDDPLKRIATDLAQDARVLCLDELHVADIADAMLLGGLFEGLVERGVALVFTSNVPPSGLYHDGLQRAHFLPAIALLEEACEVVPVDTGVDYRLRQLSRAPLYLDCADESADRELRERFAAIAGKEGAPGGEVEIEHRRIPLRRRAGGVAWFDFRALCEGPRAAADYIEIARQFHTVVVSDVPLLGGHAGDDPARRFVTLVDELYDRGVKLVLSAAAPPPELYRGERLAFEFRRTASRLAEMQSYDYLARPHRP